MPVEISVKSIRKLCNPIANPPWGCPNFTYESISKAVTDGRFNRLPFSDGIVWSGTADDSLQHIERIAYFVYEGWDDAIELDIGVPALGCYVDWPVLDGNHRLAAAIYRRDRHILASVSGDINYALELFGVDVTETYVST